MPEITQFYGIHVTMYYDDHSPPHFHAEYGKCKVIVGINNAKILHGTFPLKQSKLLLAWCVIHQKELLQNWKLAKEKQILRKISPLI